MQNWKKSQVPRTWDFSKVGNLPWFLNLESKVQNKWVNVTFHIVSFLLVVNSDACSKRFFTLCLQILTLQSKRWPWLFFFFFLPASKLISWPVTVVQLTPTEHSVVILLDPFFIFALLTQKAGVTSCLKKWVSRPKEK